jgi:hypothetical protein
MKTLNTFFKEDDNSKPKPVDKNTGENDALYFKFMDQYKILRRKGDREGAKKALDKAEALKNVSARAKMGAAYL